MTPSAFETRVSDEALLNGNPYVAYAYAYPHKAAYRALCPPVPLERAWCGEGRDSLFLYLHVPFCEMRCGFCNLLTSVNAPASLWEDVLVAMERQARSTAAALPGSTFSAGAVGGGTPTFLPIELLDRLLRVPEILGADTHRLSLSVETSPGTAEPDKLRLLRDCGTERVSIGVQSLSEAETRAVGRPQDAGAVMAALEQIRETGFRTLNVDLIYGLPGQTPRSWEASLRGVLAFAPEELYLYPLYARPKTGLERMVLPEEDRRLDLYRQGRSLLLGEGYEQVSMRMFRRPVGTVPGEAPAGKQAYRCQEDGTVGLGCGARSYTRALHYSTEYAVSPGAVRSLIRDYSRRTEEEFGSAHHGYALDGEDRRRRYLLQSLLQTEGLSLSDYRERFGTDVLADLPELALLREVGQATVTEERLLLTVAGIERSDVIGPWLYSKTARERMEAYEWR